MNEFSRLVSAILLALVFCMPLFAETPLPPVPLELDQVVIDGNANDWARLPAFMEEFGLPQKEGNAIDVKSFHMGFTKEAFLFKAELAPSPSEISPANLSPGGNLSILQIFFDIDINENTGSTDRNLKIYKIVPRGFDYRLELTINKNKMLTASLYSHKNRFMKKLANWGAKHPNIKSKGNIVEMKVPYNAINFPASGEEANIRILFAEFANMDSAKGYSKQKIRLDFAAIGKALAPALAANVAKPLEKESEETSSEGGFSIWHLFVVMVWLLFILCSFAIAPKAGLSSGLAAINFVPFLGQVIFLLILAFGRWPLHEDYQELEERLRGYEDL